MMHFIPRNVYFRDGFCIGAGFSSVEKDADKVEVILLPTEHYDFLGPIEVLNKTKTQIELEASKYLTHAHA